MTTGQLVYVCNIHNIFNLYHYRPILTNIIYMHTTTVHTILYIYILSIWYQSAGLYSKGKALSMVGSSVDVNILDFCAQVYVYGITYQKGSLFKSWIFNNNNNIAKYLTNNKYM